jgi:hypothetical protein
MSEQTLCIIITVLVIALMFVWVPILEFICPPCGRAIERLRRKKIATDDAAGKGIETQCAAGLRATRGRVC